MYHYACAEKRCLIFGLATSTEFSTRVLGKINDGVLSYLLEDSEIGIKNQTIYDG